MANSRRAAKQTFISSAICGRRLTRISCCCARLCTRVDPTRLYTGGKRFVAFQFRILSNEATKCRLDVATRTAKPVIEVEVAEGGIEVVVVAKGNNARD